MKINVGPFPIGVRIKSSVALAGAVNVHGTTVFEPAYIDGIYQYVDPADYTDDTVDAGGLIDFEYDKSILIKEVRSHVGAGKKITAVICDRDGTNPINMFVAASDGHDTVYAFGNQAYVLLPTQVIKITTDNGGVVDVYAVIGAQS